MNIVAQEVSKIVSDILVNLLYAGALAGLFYAKKLWSKWHSLLDSKLTASQHQLLDTICQTAVVYIGKQWQEKGGQEKFSLAVTHVLDVAKDYGINVSVQDVQAKIEAAYQMSKVVGNTSEPTASVSVTLDGKELAQTIAPTIISDQVVQAIAGPTE